MKKRLLSMLAALAVIQLSACSSGGDPSVSDDSSPASQVDDTSASETVPASSEGELSSDTETVPDVRTMAVLSINTTENGGSLDFVTEPVASHVSSSVASWTPGYKIPPAPYYEKCTVTLTDKDGKECLSAAEANVKVRGNWTTFYDKKPLRIKFEQKQSMLELNDGAEMKNWVLIASYKDVSMLRDKAALSISREILGKDSLYAADAEFVEVYINNEYWGVYLLSEMQQINENRVNITEAEKEYTGTDIGYFMEFDGYFTNEDALHSFRMSYADNAPLIPYDGEGGNGQTINCLNTGRGDQKQDTGISIKSDIYSQEQHDFIASYVNNVYDIMYYAAYNDEAYVFSDDYSEIIPASDISPQEAVEKVVNTDSLADMYIISELTCDADIYWSSFFMDADFGPEGDKRLTFEAPWDFDSALGNKPRCTDGTGFYASNVLYDVNNVYKTINPWLAVLAYEDWFQDIVKEKWTDAYDSGVFTRAADMISSDTALHSAAFERNYEKWNNLLDKSAFESELSNASKKCKTHEEAAQYLSEWLGKRVDFLNGQWHE